MFIRDRYDIYGVEEEDKFNTITIDSIQTYITARKEIEKLKNLETDKRLLIVIKKKNFLNLFKDIEIISTSTDILPKNRFKKIINHDINIPYWIKEEDILELDLLKNEKETKKIVTRLIERYDGDVFVKNILLTKVLGDEVFNYDGKEFDIEKIKDIFRYISTANLSKIYKGVNNSTFNRIFFERLDDIENNAPAYMKKFVRELSRSIKNKNVEDFINYILVESLIQNYNSALRSWIIEDLGYADAKFIKNKEILTILDNEIKTLYKKTVIDKKVDNFIKHKWDEVDELSININSLNATDFSECIKKHSGYFEEELNRLILKFLDCANNDYSNKLFDYENASRILNMIKSKFEPLLEKYKKVDKKIVFANNFIDFANEMGYIKSGEPVNFSEWVDVYGHILKSDELCHSIASGTLFKRISTEIVDEYSGLKSDKIKKYEEYLFNNFPRFLDPSTTDRPLMAIDVVNKISELVNDDNIVVFLVIDALRLDIWYVLKEIFEENGYILETEEVMLSMIPSFTGVSRRSLFGGMHYWDLINLRKKFDINPNNEAQIFAHALRFDFNKIEEENGISYIDKKLVYAKGFKNIKYALKKDAKVHAILISEEMDGVIETVGVNESALKAGIKSMFKEAIEPCLKDIKDIPNVKIVLATDHGFISVDQMNKKRLRSDINDLKEKGYGLDWHGRHLVLTLIDDSVDPKQIDINEILQENANDWFILYRDNIGNYGLPWTCKMKTRDIHEGETPYKPVLALLLCKEGYYLRKGKGSYVHGGLSFYETIIPFVVMSPGKVEIIEPIVGMTYNKYRVGEESMIDINITNPNKNDLKDMKITIEEFDIYNWHIKDVKANDSQKVHILIIPKKSGDIKFGIKGTYKVGDRKYELLKKTGKIKVRKSREEEQKIKRHADDLFDEMLNE